MPVDVHRVYRTSHIHIRYARNQLRWFCSSRSQQPKVSSYAMISTVSALSSEIGHTLAELWLGLLDRKMPLSPRSARFRPPPAGLRPWPFTRKAVKTGCHLPCKLPAACMGHASLSGVPSRRLLTCRIMGGDCDERVIGLGLRPHCEPSAQVYSWRQQRRCTFPERHDKATGPFACETGS